MRTKGEGNLRWVEFVLLNQEVFNDFADAAGSMLEPAVSPASAQQKRKADRQEHDRSQRFEYTPDVATRRAPVSGRHFPQHERQNVADDREAHAAMPDFPVLRRTRRACKCHVTTVALVISTDSMLDTGHDYKRLEPWIRQ